MSNSPVDPMTGLQIFYEVPAFIPIPNERSLRPVKNRGNCFLNEGYISGKSLKLMSPDALISAQNAPKCVWRPGSTLIRWVAHTSPQIP